MNEHLHSLLKALLFLDSSSLSDSAKAKTKVEPRAQEIFPLSIAIVFLRFSETTWGWSRKINICLSQRERVAFCSQWIALLIVKNKYFRFKNCLTKRKLQVTVINFGDYNKSMALVPIKVTAHFTAALPQLIDLNNSSLLSEHNLWKQERYSESSSMNNTIPVMNKSTKTPKMIWI